MASFKPGWYIDARNGHLAALIPNQCIIHDGIVRALPAAQNLLQLRISPDGQRIVGTGHQDGHAWEWIGVKWIDRGLAFGNNACIYDDEGQLHVVRAPGEFPGSQGWRFDNGTDLIACWETYDPSTPMSVARGLQRIWQWTAIPGFVVGQGEHGVIAIDQETHKRHRIASGQTTFVRAYRAGDVITVSWVQEDQGAAESRELTVERLRALPLEEELPPPIDEEEEEENEEPVVETPNHFHIVQQTSNAHAHLIQQNTPGTIRALYQRVARALFLHDPQWGMLTKTPGENHQLVAGQPVAVDAVIYKKTQQVVDIFSSAGDGPGKGGLVWGHQPKRDSNNWIVPLWDLSEEEPGEDEDNNDDLVGLIDELQREHDEMERQLADMRSHNAKLAGDIAHLRDRLNGLQTPDVTAALTALLPRLRLVGDPNLEPPVSVSSGLFGHSHQLRAGIVLTDPA